MKKGTNINKVFNLVVTLLEQFAAKVGCTYNEINILVYYFLIPFSWLAMLDIIFGFHYLKIGFLCFGIGFRLLCKDFSRFADWAFEKSVDFLNYFNRFGSNYFASSVWICVALPILIYIALFVMIACH